MIIHVCDKKKSISPYLKPCMTSNFSKSKKKTLFMMISTIRCIDLFSNRERLRREELGKHTGDASSFPIPVIPRALFLQLLNLLFLENPLRASTDD